MYQHHIPLVLQKNPHANIMIANTKPTLSVALTEKLASKVNRKFIFGFSFQGVGGIFCAGMVL